MAFNYRWIDPEVLEDIISQSREFETDDPL